MARVETDSILMSIKKMLNVEHDDDAFDTDIGLLINSEFMTLQQLGIGPKDGFRIHDADATWGDFSDDKTLIEAVKEYVYLRVRMVFDPPASSIVADAFNSKIAELTWRLNVQAEKNATPEIDPDSLKPSPGDGFYKYNSPVFDPVASQIIIDQSVEPVLKPVKPRGCERP